MKNEIGYIKSTWKQEEFIKCKTQALHSLIIVLQKLPLEYVAYSLLAISHNFIFFATTLLSFKLHMNAKLN